MQEAGPPENAEAATEDAGIRWPPPGLERLQGDLGIVAARAALSGGILVLPLLFVVAGDLDFATLGPFADAWWVTVVLAAVGLSFAVDALIRTMRLLRRVARALDQGYDLGTIVRVLADSPRDTGFLLTGARHYSVIDAREREAIATIRISSRVMFAIAGIWLPNALAIGLLLASRGLVSPAGLWMGTLLPSVAMYGFAAVARTVEDSRVRRAKGKWHEQPWAEDLASEEAGQWRSDAAARIGAPVGAPTPGGLAKTLRRSSIVTGLLAGVVALPILTLVPTVAVGPILAALAVPSFDTVRGRAARAEALRPYRLQADASLSPAEAGQLLHDMQYYGSDREMLPGERPPSRRVEEPWLPETEGPNPMGVAAFAWGDSLLLQVASGISGEQRQYLTRMAGHPGRVDFSRLARAAAIDVASARYESPLPDHVTVATVPVANMLGIRNGAQSHLGVAALELVEGREDRAEELVAEVISVGFLLADGGPSLLDNVIGLSLVMDGAQALAGLYDVTGQAAEADRLAELMAASQRASQRTGGPVGIGAESWLRALPDVVTDTTVTRGVRWESFISISTLTPCINLHRMVFGPGEEYEEFLERARASLVMWPSEEGLFEVARRGFFRAGLVETTWLGRLLGISMRRGESACSEIVQGWEAARLLS